MRSTTIRRLAWLACAILIPWSGGAAGQTHEHAAQVWFEDAYRRLDVDATAEEVAHLAELWVQATDGRLPAPQRRDSLRALLDAMIRIQDVPAWRYTSAALDAMADRVGQLEGLVAPPPLLPVEAGAWREPGRIEVVGGGPVPLVLISSVDYGGSVYRSFAEAHGDRFTSYIVTIPGAEGTPPPPLEGRVSATPWLDNVEAIVLDLVQSRNLERPVVVGVMAGAYTAARLALDHPERFRAAVLLHGLVNAPRFSPLDPTRTMTEEERIAWTDATLPPLFPIDTAAAVRAYRRAAGGTAVDSVQANALTERAARTHPAVYGRYIAELGATDLHDDFARLELPTLVIPSIHDARSPVASTEMGSGQWLSLSLDRPEIPLLVVPFRSTRNYAPADRPYELGGVVEAFLAGRTPRGPPAEPALAAYQVSPAAESMGVLGATEVRVSYSAPGVKGRPVWGGLVPWDQVWRAGANAATRIAFSQDVLVEGRALAAGGYGFFVIPREQGPWTLVFNRVDIQVGSFFYEPRHDALRIDVEPEPAPHQEALTYRIESLPPVQGRVVLRWADRQVGFDVLAREGTGLDRIAATDPLRLDALDWTELAEDPVDGARPGGPDARAVGWAMHADTVWFRIRLHEPADSAGVGVNVVLDTDVDPATGSAWWGGRSGFTFDRVATVWVARSGGTYWGTVGISDAAAATAGDFRALGRANLDFAMSADGRTLYVGAPAAELDDDGRVRLIVAIGTNALWNDNLLDAAPPTLHFRR
jgi:pimeloyl-ACP methyl ester carboxylesterase